MHQRASLDALDQLNEHVVKHADLIFVQAVGISDEQVSNMPNYRLLPRERLNRRI